MVLTTTPARGSRRWATPAAAGLLAAAVLLSGMGLVRADDPPKDPPTPAEVKPADKLKDEAAKLRDAAAKLRDEMRADRDKMQADKEKLRDESRADPEKRRGTPPPASEGQRGDVRTRIYTEKDGTIQLRIDVTGVAELKKQIAEALKANRPEAVMDLVAKLEKMLTANAPQPRGSRAIESTVTREPPSAAPAGSAGGPLVPPAPPAPPSAFRSLAPPTPTVQPRANLFAPALPNEAITALEKVLEANKDPETRASLVRAIAMLRSQNQSGQGFGFGPAAGGLAQPAGPPPLAAPVGGPPGYPTAGAFNPPGGFGGPPGMPSPDAIGNRSTSISTYGIVVAPLSEALAEQLQLKGRGVLVTAVKADSPFAKAGVKKNDILIAINRVVTDSVMDSTRKLAALSPGGVVTLRVLSKGKEADIDVPVPQPTEPARPGAKKVRFESKSVRTTHDTFSIEAKLGSVEYKITGKLNAGKVTSFNATVTEDKEVITVGQSLLEGDKDIDFGVTVAKYAPELKALLDSVRGQ